MGQYPDHKYRPCVGIMLLNRERNVWVGKRIMVSKNIDGGSLWQMPQGGIDKGETPEKAAMRELEEEVGTDKARIIAEHPDWLKYDLPALDKGNMLKGQYVGQKQKWFALEFTGEDTDFNLTPDCDEVPEFSEWMWTPMETLPDLIVPFKRDVYLEVVRYFSQVCGPDHLS